VVRIRTRCDAQQVGKFRGELLSRPDYGGLDHRGPTELRWDPRRRHAGRVRESSLDGLVNVDSSHRPGRDRMA